jgi:5-oxoprolinase (ATP-hydrolysing) subunit C
MNALRVLRPGLHSLIVDSGRPATRSLGVPVSGAADAFSLAIGNALVGNRPDAAALEITLSGPTLLLPKEAVEPVALVIHGAPFEIHLVRGGERRKLPSGTTGTLYPGWTLHVGGTPTGARAYLCVKGGFQTPFLLESRSALRPIQEGEQLPCLPGHITGRFVKIPAEDATIVSAGPVALAVLPGGQADWFPMEGFLGVPFTVSSASNRMGLRLEGTPLPWPGRELVSEPVCPGTVQVTREGLPIVLGVDGQTIGGYPKIAHVITAHLDLLGQLRPGQRVKFHAITLEEAQELARRRQHLRDTWVARLLSST